MSQSTQSSTGERVAALGMDLGTGSVKSVVIHLDGTVIGQGTGDHAASNTLLYDPTTDAWDTKVIDALGLNAAKLPRRSAPTVETF